MGPFSTNFFFVHFQLQTIGLYAKNQIPNSFGYPIIIRSIYREYWKENWKRGI